MRSICDGRVVIVTGAGNGIGRSHALAFAREGAKVVVNDLGGARDGSGGSLEPARAVANEITDAGGHAVANAGDVSTGEGARELIAQAVEAFGRLDVLVNNAGILRDRTIVTMAEAEWDAVIRVHLKGTFAPSRYAAEYWRGRTKAGEPVDARIINTTSPSGLFGNVGQANYSAAKAGIAAFTLVAAKELKRYGVTVNAVAPTALTRMTEDLGALVDATEETRHALDPANTSPLVVWLGSAEAREITGRVFVVRGHRISVAEGWAYGPDVESEERWQPALLGETVPKLVAMAAANADMSGARS